jgi:hypothetical protein
VAIQLAIIGPIHDVGAPSQSYDGAIIVRTISDIYDPIEVGFVSFEEGVQLFPCKNGM